MIVYTVVKEARIEFLRKQNTGRALFLVLEKLPIDKLNKREITSLAIRSHQTEGSPLCICILPRYLQGS